MAIIIASRWKGDYEKALPILRELSPIMKAAGATSVVAGRCFSGPGTDLIHTAVTFPDFATYGKSRENAEFQRVHAEFLKVVEVHDRSVLIGGEV